jgi:hypothetical protein
MSDPDTRKPALSESDLDRIGEAFDKRLTSFCEVIGYDVTTPESRSAIRDDHKFVRALRRAAVWLIGVVVVAAAGAAAAGWLG